MSDVQRHAEQAEDAPVAYHIELRQFPHNLCHFNMTQQELQATIVGPWARERWIELGERKWNPQQAKLTVLEGPHIPVEQLSMGRGWRVAQRQSQDVTAGVLAAAHEAVTSESPGAPSASVAETRPPTDEGLLADSLGLELLTVLSAGQVPLRRAWELASVRHPERTAGQCLVLAERAVASLAEAQLIALVQADRSEGNIQRPAEHIQRQVEQVKVREVLCATDSWTGEIVALTRR